MPCVEAGLSASVRDVRGLNVSYRPVRIRLAPPSKMGPLASRYGFGTASRFAIRPISYGHQLLVEQFEGENGLEVQAGGAPDPFDGNGMNILMGFEGITIVAEGGFEVVFVDEL